MDLSAERRDTRRVFLGSDHAIRFLVKGHPFHNVRITNVSAGGCFAMVSRRDHSLFAHGTVLEQLCFEHPDLPHAPITAEVRYAIGTQSEQPLLEFLGVGIRFLSMPDETERELRAFIGV